MSNGANNDPLSRALEDLAQTASEHWDATDIVASEVDAVAAFIKEKLARNSDHCTLYEHHVHRVERALCGPDMMLYRVYGYLDFYDAELDKVFSTTTQKYQVVRLANGDFMEPVYEEIFRKAGVSQ